MSPVFERDRETALDGWIFRFVAERGDHSGDLGADIDSFCGKRPHHRVFRSTYFTGNAVGSCCLDLNFCYSDPCLSAVRYFDPILIVRWYTFFVVIAPSKHYT